MDFRRKKRTSVEIGLIPMIDVLLVLLFFFMLATTFRNQSQLQINLPQAYGKSDQQASLGKMINLLINAESVYSVVDASGKSIPLARQDLASLKIALTQIADGATDLPFIINADGKTPHQAVVSAMDVASQLGFHHITFAIKTTEQP